MATNDKAQQPWDAINSTYWWQIKLDPSHSLNSPLGHTLTGYSKRQGHDEAQDKEMLLMRKVLTLATQGYIQRSLKIEFYWKQDAMVNKSTDPLLFTLFKNDFRLGDRLLKPKYEAVRNFLDKLYLTMQNQGNIRNLLPKSKPTFSKDDWFNISKIHFTTQEQLVNYCTKLIKNGHAFDLVVKFRNDYETYRPDIAKTPSHV